MFKILFLLFILFIFITVYSFKKRIDGILDNLFPPKEKGSSGQMEELVRCANCGTYIPRSQAVKKFSFRGSGPYFCSAECKEEYYKSKR